MTFLKVYMILYIHKILYWKYIILYKYIIFCKYIILRSPKLQLKPNQFSCGHDLKLQLHRLGSLGFLFNWLQQNWKGESVILIIFSCPNTMTDPMTDLMTNPFDRPHVLRTPIPTICLPCLALLWLKPWLITWLTPFIDDDDNYDKGIYEWVATCQRRSQVVSQLATMSALVEDARLIRSSSSSSSSSQPQSSSSSHTF